MKNNKQVVTMSKRRINIGASMLMFGAMIEGAVFATVVLDSFMNGAITDKIADKVGEIQKKRVEKVMSQFPEIVQDPKTGIYDVASSTDADAHDECVAEMADLADYSEACTLVGYEIGHENWELWKADPKFSMEALRAHYGK